MHLGLYPTLIEQRRISYALLFDGHQEVEGAGAMSPVALLLPLWVHQKSCGACQSGIQWDLNPGLTGESHVS